MTSKTLHFGSRALPTLSDNRLYSVVYTGQLPHLRFTGTFKISAQVLQGTKNRPPSFPHAAAAKAECCKAPKGE